MHEYVAIEEVDSEGLDHTIIGTTIARELIETWCPAQPHWIVYSPFP